MAVEKLMTLPSAQSRVSSCAGVTLVFTSYKVCPCPGAFRTHCHSPMRLRLLGQDLAPSGGTQMDGAAGHDLKLPKGKHLLHLAGERRRAGWTDSSFVAAPGAALQRGNRTARSITPKPIPESLSHPAGSKQCCLAQTMALDF